MSGKFFRVGEVGSHWWLIDPDGRPFFSIGMNHIDSAALRYPETRGVWDDTYRDREELWIRNAVARDLTAWGFNTLGWTQEVVLRGSVMRRHHYPVGSKSDTRPALVNSLRLFSRLRGLFGRTRAKRAVNHGAF